MRDRAWRRAETKRVQEKRIKLWSRIGWKTMDRRHQGMARKSNFSCGCVMCKPWKYGKTY